MKPKAQMGIWSKIKLRCDPRMVNLKRYQLEGYVENPTSEKWRDLTILVIKIKNLWFKSMVRGLLNEHLGEEGWSSCLNLGCFYRKFLAL